MDEATTLDSMNDGAASEANKSETTIALTPAQLIAVFVVLGIVAYCMVRRRRAGRSA